LFRRRWATCFAFGFALAVAALDVTAPAPYRSWGFYGWAGFVTAVVFVGVTCANWRKHKTFVLPGVLRLREAVFFMAAVAVAASVTARATAALPLAYTFTTLPGWPSFYLLLYLVIVGVGAFFWFTGRDLRPWLLFTLLTVGAANGQLLNLAAGGYAIFFGFAAAVYFYQAETSGPTKRRLSYMEGAVLIFVGVALLGGLWSQDWGGSFRSVYFLTAGVLVFLIFARELETAEV